MEIGLMCLAVMYSSIPESPLVLATTASLFMVLGKAKGHHGHYLICTGCQEKIRLEDCPLHELEHKLTDETGFTITDHDLTLYGLCPACKGKTKNGK